MKAVRIEITITGKSDDGFTAAELSCVTQQERHFIGRVFELQDGWHYETVPTVGSLDISLDRLVSEIEKAKEALRPYVNRTGRNPPPELTAAEFSLWLHAKGANNIKSGDLSGLISEMRSRIPFPLPKHRKAICLVFAVFRTSEFQSTKLDSNLGFCGISSKWIRERYTVYLA